ncbi:MAG TPA: cytochrome c oxidase subunit 3 [Candidatus Thermoplasmatota archaeon]|nr:cytochrome c oxidase subunit 3 [Candidatus Thermoplasmatota archaeon]
MEHLTWTPILLGAGILALYLSLELRESFAFAPVAGIVLFLIPLFMWIKEDVHFWHTNYQDHGVMPGQPLGWWGMMFFLGTEVALFGSLFAAFFVARSEHPGIWTAAREHVEHALPLVTVNTLILVTSGVFMHWGLHSIRKDNRRNFFIGLIGAMVLGATFLVIQLREYIGLINAGVTFSGGDNFGNAFYGLTGTHAAHVFLGLCFITLILVRGLMGQYDSKRHVSVDAFTIYWHFVDVVWIGLYLIVYVGVF